MEEEGANVNAIFKKCGEIFLTVESDKNVYLMQCISCNELFSQLDELISHIEIKHSDDMQDEYQQEDEMHGDYSEIDGEYVKQDDYDHEFEEFNETCDTIMEINAVEDIDDNIQTRENLTDINDANICISRINAPPINNTDEKVLTLAIILDYEKQRILWDPEMETTEEHFINDAYDKISRSIKKQLNLHLSRESVEQRITKLNHCYHTEMQNKLLALSAGEKYTLPWYFDKLRFLEIRTKSNDSNNGSNKGLGLPLPYLSDEQHTDLFEIYQSFPCLWDIQHIGFHTKKQRQEALQEMSQILKSKMNLNYTPEQLQRKLYQIRYTCTQEKQRKLECERLKKQFKPQCKYYEQIAFLEENVHPFKCPYCADVFNAPQPYHVHKSKHDGSRPFKCPVCKRGFMTAGNCTVHLRRHTQEFPFSCEVCEKRFPSSSEVTIHMRYHSGEKPYVCEVCGLSFYRSSYLEYHKRRHENNRSFKCTQCPKAFYDNHLLKEHNKVHSNIRDKVCNVCYKSFTCIKHLRQHQLIHSNVKKYVCKVCGKDFAQYAGLSGHMKSHKKPPTVANDFIDSGTQ